MKLPVFSTRTTGKENVRVYRDGWPTAVHYEFCDRGDAISIEVQVRHAEYPRLREFLPRLHEYLPTVIRNTQRVELVTDDFGWTRLQFFFGEEIDPYWIAQAMVRLCMTENDLSVLLQEGSS